MACLDMYNSDHKGSTHHSSSWAAPMSPRISFSNDFVESHQIAKQERRDIPVSSDFEFSVSNYSMMSADELFSKGKLLPFRDTTQMQRTLREELLVEIDDDNDDVFQMRPPKGSPKWKGFLSLKKSHIGSKKVEKTEGSAEKAHDSKTKQELLNGGGPSCRDVQIGI